jgi:L-glyceraldehyde 3-phosphate reductase
MDTGGFMKYLANNGRYGLMNYRRCGKSGLMLPEVSLGLWHNFGDVDVFENSKRMILNSFDIGITHFDLANNYGPPPGSAETNFGRIISDELGSYRDELVISTKAGYKMWEGPYGDWASKKYLISSLDQSLKRMNLEYVDIFYSHRFDPLTPLEETACALDLAVRQGKALYAGISNYRPDETLVMIKIFDELKTPFIIHQARYSMFDRWIEDGLLDVLEKSGKGCIAFSPLAQGLLTDRYLDGIPGDSRMKKEHGFLKEKDLTDDKLGKVRNLQKIAETRNQTISELALSWILRSKTVTSVIIGASRMEQVYDNVKCIKNTSFPKGELDEIDRILNGSKGSS